ncbi:hypothetical protein K435DRAFT_800555 [Dendrothele bispora CBS 962.96]|uniref:Ubiquitin-like protease family profile domain-containing protein n=1 Tax=Dendrothele bispora (strain CBS 962.96) TaxID=1314807 RepID=A0A4S8LTK6_DENBC|nr:hypothetical protein K435DRAFT_800555 [Dendrothele bispora CBS 962.96]
MTQTPELPPFFLTMPSTVMGEKSYTNADLVTTSQGLQAVAVRFTYIRAQSHQLPSLKHHTKTYQDHFKALLQTMRCIRSTTKGPQKAQTSAVLTRKAVQNLQNATGIKLNLKSAKEVWAEPIEGINICMKDIERIQNGWISDELTTFFLAIHETEFTSRGVYTLILPSGSDHKGEWEADPSRLVRKRKFPWGDLNLMKRLLVPIYQPDHWIMAVVDFEKDFIAVYNSLNGKSQHGNIFKILRTWILTGVKERLNDNLVNPGLQNNGVDCGVFVIGHMILLSYPQDFDRAQIGDILISQVVPILRAHLFSIIKNGAVESQEDITKERRSQRLMSGNKPTEKPSAKYDYLPKHKWGAGSYMMAPVSSDPVSEAEKSE